ncbi:hypothetical protein DNTS_022308 [Danionella cerebrum]|uniref:Zinc-finger CCCH domain-containing protein n=1 Tax=Danionella cerebrum TaxID=2873325 RepID=A0A553R809_9TELE|nr:hypothetical protein DNTS_022308 [Danionella translucida]
MGSETVCSLWQEQRCFRNICSFRHMEIKKNRKEIACYWETQPAGCLKPHCAFHHERPRIINGNFLSPDKEAPHEEQANQPLAPSSNPTNPKLIGVKRTETQENVPSPTHPPVVINPVDDDDEDDQFSEEGDDSLGPSPRKLIASKKDGLDFGIQTLEEIRLRKALMSNLKKARAATIQSSAQNSATAIEKENHSISLKFNSGKIDLSVNEIVGKGNIADRLGKRVYEKETPVEELPLKRSLSERLGGMVGSSTDQPKKAQKPVRERLGLTIDTENTDKDPKPSGNVRIKTLEEIRKEKADRNLKSRKVRVVKEVPQELSPSKKTVKLASGPQVKTFSEILHEKKKMQELKAQEVKTTAKSPERSDCASTVEAGVKTPAASGEVRVKTLEEIRKEKAARMQTQLQDSIDDKTPSSSVIETSRVLRTNKTSPQITVGQSKFDTSNKKLEPATEVKSKSEPSSEPVKVKTFEEIMREKRLRKLQEEKVTSSNQNDAGTTVPGTIPPTVESSSNKPQTTLGSRITLKAKSTPVVPTSEVTLKTSPECTAVTIPPKPSTVETKVKPKVNVKPSVVKLVAPAAQKRKAGKTHSAVAEVKPLNSACQAPLSQLSPNKRQKVESPSSPAAPQADTQQLISSIPEEKPTAPIACSEPSSTTSTDTVVVTQSPVIKSPSVPRSRRSSSAATKAPVVTSSSVDDFEDLLDEFTDDRLEDSLELDSGKGEDDLLLELSEMIDS